MRLIGKLAALSLLIAVPSIAQAASMTYTFSGSFAGTLNGAAFNAPLTIGTTTDPSTMTSSSNLLGMTPSKEHPLTSTTIADIQGLGQVTITRSPAHFYLRTATTAGATQVTASYQTPETAVKLLSATLTTDLPPVGAARADLTLSTPGVYSGSASFSGTAPYSTSGGRTQAHQCKHAGHPDSYSVPGALQFRPARLRCRRPAAAPRALIPIS